MNKILATLALVLLPVIASAQVPGGWTQGPTVLWRFQCDPTFTADGTCVSAPTTGFFGYTLTNGSTGQTQFFQAGSVTFDPVAIGTQTVTADGVTVTYKQLIDLNAQAADDQWAAQNAATSAAKAKAAPPK